MFSSASFLLLHLGVGPAVGPCRPPCLVASLASQDGFQRCPLYPGVWLTYWAALCFTTYHVYLEVARMF